MNYVKIYNQIIDKRLNDPPHGYSEGHHILPRSLGGNDDKENLVRLTAREHFICHYLLSKMYKRGSVEWYKMQRAFNMMNVSSTFHNDQRYINSRLFEAKRKDIAEAMSIAQSGQGNSNYGKVWISNCRELTTIPVFRSDLPGYLKAGWVIGRSYWNTLENNKREDLRKLKLNFSKAILEINTDDRYQDRLSKTVRLSDKYYLGLEKETIKWYKKFIDGEYKSIRDFSTHIGVSAMTISKRFNKYIPEYANRKNKRIPIKKELKR